MFRFESHLRFTGKTEEGFEKEGREMEEGGGQKEWQKEQRETDSLKGTKRKGFGMIQGRILKNQRVGGWGLFKKGKTRK